ncbi:DUF7692 domain-containing protein [Halococcus salifodinae]|uniref:DUF7692 domain-containing protein n=1 Tax=Halococcus salifodinae DSM 8989 TaxID=1227456 RepID=M0NF57_9EURY|nr:hypothetical protein [Halococcus salifodinae]EMA55734.1 hypothetical protein C450_00872 [Halococcus salifodinae DSM 8989]
MYERVIRIRTDGKFAYRKELVDDVADLLGENTRVGAIEASTELTQAMIPALERAVEHEDMTPGLAEILSTRVGVQGLGRRERARVGSTAIESPLLAV